MAIFSRYTCPSCRTWKSLSSQRPCFTTSSINQSIPPESPYYVDIPQTIQRESPFPRQIKGILPVPREIFPPRKPDKHTVEFINRATPDKSKQTKERRPSRLSEREEYKDRMAVMHKMHLREGLTELHRRKQRMIKQVANRSQDRAEERSRLLTQAEREDERLTSSTILPELLPGFKPDLPEDSFKARTNARRVNVEAHQTARKEDRRDALHTLYVNAQTFITTEEKLNDTVDKSFPDGPNPAFQDGEFYGSSVWNIGYQPTVEGLLNHQKKTTRSGSSQKVEEGKTKTIHETRLNRIAEELSGGKIPSAGVDHQEGGKKSYAGGKR